MADDHGSTAPRGLAVRAAGPYDADLIAAMHAVCFDARWDRPWNASSIARILATPFGHGLVAAIGGKADAEPVGFNLIRVLEGEAELLSIGVLKSHRRRRIGAYLLCRAADNAARLGASRLLLEVATENLAALALYRGNDFEPAGLRPGYYVNDPGRPVDAQLMQKRLVPRH